MKNPALLYVMLMIAEKTKSFYLFMIIIFDNKISVFTLFQAFFLISTKLTQILNYLDYFRLKR